MPGASAVIGTPRTIIVSSGRPVTSASPNPGPIARPIVKTVTVAASNPAATVRPLGKPVTVAASSNSAASARPLGQPIPVAVVPKPVVPRPIVRPANTVPRGPGMDDFFNV